MKIEVMEYESIEEYDSVFCITIGVELDYDTTTEHRLDNPHMNLFFDYECLELYDIELIDQGEEIELEITRSHERQLLEFVQEENLLSKLKERSE